jgi:hypothetical protein
MAPSKLVFCHGPWSSCLPDLSLLISWPFDVVDQDNKENRLDIPVGVENQVRYAQLIAIVITVISQDEVRQSLNVLYTGYDQDIVSRAFHHPSDASVSVSHRFGCSMGFRWYLSLILRLVAGILGLAVTFMLLITVDSI